MDNVIFEPPPALPTFYYDPKVVSQTGGNFRNNNFVQFLKQRFGEEATKKAVLDYLIGTSDKWPGATIFWQIDHKAKVRHGKIMLYDPETGSRSKTHFSTVKKVPEGYNLRQCLFGLHLTKENKGNRVAIVESEKTAIIMSILYKDFVWMATGGKGNFKQELLKPIKSYDIIAFPDKDGIEQWRQTADRLNKYGFRIRVDDTLERMNVDDNTDLADIFLGQVREYSQAELQVKKLAAINPAILMLIEEFGLVDEQNNPINIA
jgi:hypothetical protein